MNNQPIISNLYYSTKVSKSLYETAVEYYNKECYTESLKCINIAFDKCKTKHAQSPYTVREAALLYAWNLQQLHRNEECVNWLENAKINSLISEEDPEANIIEFWVKVVEGKYAEIICLIDDYIEMYSKKLDPLLAEFCFLRGFANVRIGQNEKALEDCEIAYTLFRIQKKEKNVAETSNIMGILFLQQSNYCEAIKWFKRSQQINYDLKVKSKLGGNYLNVGIAYYKLAKYNDAQNSVKKSVKLFLEEHDEFQLCRAYIALGNIYRLIGDLSEARKHLMSAYTLATEQRIPREECLALEFLGDVYRDEGKPEEALRFYKRGLAIANRIAPEGDLVMELWRREGECLEQLDKIAEALPTLAKARSLAQNLGDRFEEGVIRRCMAVCVSRVADWNSAQKYLEGSQELLEEIDARHELAITHLSAARIYSLQADDTKQSTSPQVVLELAWENALAAQHLFLKLDIDTWLQRTKRVMSVIAKQRIAETRYRPEKVHDDVYVPENTIIAVSPGMRNILQLCDAYADFDEAVLISGETGTGKELIAQRLHQMGKRKHKPLVAINVAAVPATMFEREFFGHHRGAFSGADQDLPGYAAEADGGSLFLDEIAELPLELQPKLLRLLQEGTYTALGSPELKHSDVRLIAATNSNLKELVEAGKFRPDLFYRLRVLEIEIPPLRERSEDIVPLLNRFLSMSEGRKATVSEFFDEVSIKAMLRCRWDGNVREVAMVARRAHIGMKTEGRVRIEVGMPPNTILLTGPDQMARAAVAGSAEDDILRSRILVLLDETGGNRSETARRLSVSRTTLYRWMDRLGVPR